MSKIKILDCTLRDGGYINDWKFGKKSIQNILFNLSKANTDIVECGFLTNKPYDSDCSLFNCIETIDALLEESKNSDTMYVAMIALGEKEINPRLISDSSNSYVDGIRLTFHPDEIDRAFEYAEIIKDKGYKLFMRPVGTTNYTDKQFLDLLERINTLMPYAFYIVDTLGMMYKKDLIRQVFLVDNNLDADIKLGYHSHNNFQLAFSNAQALAEYNTEREIIIDCSANGMGRGAGNLCSELFMNYLNKEYSAHYDVLPVLEIVDQYLVPISLSNPWGYNSAYFLSAANNCHPNYATYLMTKRSLSMSSIGNILQQLPKEQKRFFNKQLIESVYRNYQSNAVNDIETITKLRKKFDGKDILVIAPGESVKSKKDTIQKYISKKKPFVISVNFIPDFVKPDMVFVGNARRYEELCDRLDIKKSIFTSNIPKLPKKAIKVNYSELVSASNDASDSSGIMILKLLKKTSVKSAALAGYDGFSKNPLDNYFNSDYCGIYEPVLLQEKTLAISEELESLSKKMKIKFVTPSIYNKGKRSKKEILMKLIDKSKRKLKKLKIRAVMKSRFILEGFYKYGDCNKGFIRKSIYLLSLYFSSLINGKNRSRPYVYERKKYTIKPCTSAPESSFAKRSSYTLMAKNFLVNDVISFDVFDTLILRPFDNPKSVFFILGELNKCPGFKRYRELAEKLARKEAFEKTGSYEVTLRDIYEKLNRFVIIDAEKAMQYEIETELNLVLANPYMQNVFKEAKNLNKKIIAVSDMYLPKDVIEKMLRKCGYDGIDEIIVSNEYEKSKRTGELFGIIKKKYGENARYIHIGDNYVSDNLSAEKSGFTPVYYKNVNARGNAHRAFDMTSLIGSAYRGIVNAKLQNGDKTYSQYYEYGYTYAGFLTLGYCNYIHNYVKNNNIEKILFLSRDGHILKAVYDKLFPDEKTEYVYWSRSAATKLTVKKFRNELLLRYIKYKIPRNMTLEKILTAMDLPQMQKPLEQSGLTPDTVLTKDNYEDIVKVFTDNWDIVVKRFERSNKAAEEYYRNVIGDSKSSCIVDIGWAASGFSALRYLIEDEWKIDCKVSGLVAGSTYLHDMDIIEAQLTKNVISSYMFSQRDNREIRREHNVKQMYSVFTEIMLSAPSPSFIGFDYDENDEIRYEFDCPETEGYEMIEQIQQGIKGFVNDYTTAFKYYPFMCNISGSDAYAVCRQVISCPEYFKNLFADYPVNRAVGSASYEMGTLGKLIENEFVK